MGLQTDKIVVANQPDTVGVNKQEKKVVVVDVTIPSESNIRKKEHEKLKKKQRPIGEQESVWGVKLSVVSMVMVSTWGCNP